MEGGRKGEKVGVEGGKREGQRREHGGCARWYIDPSLQRFSGTSDKGPSEKRTASLEKTVIIISHSNTYTTFLDLLEEDELSIVGKIAVPLQLSVLYSEAPHIIYNIKLTILAYSII